MERFDRIDSMNLPLRTLRESSSSELQSKVAQEQTELSAMLLKEREVVEALIRKNFDNYSKTSHDDGTADYVVTGLLQSQNTTLWMLRRYLP